MKTSTFIAAFLTTALTLGAGSASAATISGDSVSCIGGDFTCSTTAGSGAQFTISDSSDATPLFSVNFGSNGVILTALGGPGNTFEYTSSPTPASFAFSDVSSRFTGATLISSTTPGFVSSDLTLSTSGIVTFNVDSVTFTTGQTLNVGLTTAAMSAVPLPASAILFASAMLGMFGFAAAKSRKENNSSNSMMA